MNSYNTYKKNNTLDKWIAEEYPVKVLRNDLFNELDVAHAQDVGEEWVKRIRDWEKEEFVQENVVKYEGIKGSLDKFKWFMGEILIVCTY